MSEWRIEYDNDTGPGDESFHEWWTVTDGNRHFRCDTESDANFLFDRLSEWKPIESAPKDGTVIWAVFRRDIYPRLEPKRKDLAGWNGVQTSLRHPGVYEKDGRTWDHGWNVAAPVGSGGLPDDWIAGWMPLPSPPVTD